MNRVKRFPNGEIVIIKLEHTHFGSFSCSLTVIEGFCESLEAKWKKHWVRHCVQLPINEANSFGFVCTSLVNHQVSIRRYCSVFAYEYHGYFISLLRIIASLIISGISHYGHRDLWSTFHILMSL